MTKFVLQHSTVDAQRLTLLSCAGRWNLMMLQDVIGEGQLLIVSMIFASKFTVESHFAKCSFS
jgi:hypothetical protein